MKVSANAQILQSKVLAIGSARDVLIAIRPENVVMSRTPSGLKNEFPAELVSKLFLGDVTVYQLSVNGTKLRAKTTRPDRELTVGSDLHVQLPADKLKIFPMVDVQANLDCEEKNLLAKSQRRISSSRLSSQA